MLEDDMIELVHQDSKLLFVSELLHELGIVNHFELLIVGIDSYTGCRYSLGW
jgi:hypothetical protein